MNREFERQPIIVEKREPNRKYSLTLEEVRARAEGAGEGTVIPIFRTLPSDLDTPFSAHLKLSRKPNFSPAFLLESVTGGESVGRYSYICIDPKGGISVKDENGERVDPLKMIEKDVSKNVLRYPGLPPFSGGYVGYLAYETVGAFEDKVSISKPNVLGLPKAVLYNFDTVVAFDHARNELKMIGNIHVGMGDLDNQYYETTAKIDEIANRMETPIRFETKRTELETRERSLTSNFGKEEYMDRVRKVKDYVEAGDVIQTVISQRWARKTSASPSDIYRALRRVNPSPFMGYLDFGDFQIICASPELLLKVENGEISTWPIAGTRPRGKTPEEDEQLAKELMENEKERAEHIMLVDLGRNDVGRISKPGTVKVPRLMEVERFSNVMHLTSEVSGTLSEDRTSLDALRSIFPAGTVSGAPKIRAMQIIDEVEKEQRGPYAGALGYIDYSGNLEMAITIRTVVFKDKIAYVQAGGGIVYDSDPEAEYEETIAKARGSLRAIDLAEDEY